MGRLPRASERGLPASAGGLAGLPGLSPRAQHRRRGRKADILARLAALRGRLAHCRARQNPAPPGHLPRVRQVVCEGPRADPQALDAARREGPGEQRGICRARERHHRVAHPRRRGLVRGGPGSGGGLPGAHAGARGTGLDRVRLGGRGPCLRALGPRAEDGRRGYEDKATVGARVGDAHVAVCRVGTRLVRLGRKLPRAVEA
mmetsp:Transcript_125758/g.363822  ORF Transcript_125758/g.363822 Transcript_125758/m.363822 type:complete len:203 (+) Transcript_125758:295-903(+)